MSNLQLQIFEELLIKVYSGETLIQALEGIPKIKASPFETQRWLKIKNDIIEGRVSCLAALESYIENLRRDYHLKTLWGRKSQGPYLQSLGVFISGIIFFISSLFIFPKELSPTPISISLYLALSTAGGFWMKALINKWHTLKNEGEWLIVLQEIKQGLLSGYTLQTLIRNINLKTSIDIMTNKKYPIIREQWKTISRLDEEGKSLSAFLKASIDQYQRYFENKIEEEAEKLNFKLLAPILFCQVPAQMILILGPLVSMLKDL
jgi:hypothetical protein